MVLVAHRLLRRAASGSVLDVSGVYVRQEMPLPSAQGYNPAFVGHEDLWMVAATTSAKKLATMKVYESKIAGNSLRPIFKPNGQVWKPSIPTVAMTAQSSR